MAARIAKNVASLLTGQIVRQQGSQRVFASSQNILRHCFIATRSLSSSNILCDRMYTKDHEWVTVSDGIGKVGITAYAADKLGEIVYVEVPSEGDEVEKEEPCGAVESVKAASDLISPVTGEVVASNSVLGDQPNLVNNDPYEGGWMFTVKLSDADELTELLNEDAYKEFCESED